MLDRLVKDIVSDQASYYPPELVKASLGGKSDNSSPQDLLKKIQPTPETTDLIQKIGSLSLTNSEQPTKFFSPSSLPMPHHAGTAVPGTIPVLPHMNPSTFNLPRFIPLLSERINVLNSSTRMCKFVFGLIFVLVFVQWIVVLSSVPDLEILSYLPDFLEGLFGYLSDENGDVRVATINLLQSFLKDITAVVKLQRSHGVLNIIDSSVAGPSGSVVLSPETEAGVLEKKTSAEAMPPPPSQHPLDDDDPDGSIDGSSRKAASIRSFASSTKKDGAAAFSSSPPVNSDPAILIRKSDDKKSIRSLESSAASVMLEPGTNQASSPVMLPPGIDSSKPYREGQGVRIDFGRMTEILLRNLGSPGIWIPSHAR